MRKQLKIRIYNYQDGVKMLGPGIRFVIWTQGCQRKCKGCMTPLSRDLDGGILMDVDILAEMIVKSGREGITISGGEPFLQAHELCELISRIHEQADMGVIIYSGFTIDEIYSSDDKYKKKLLEFTDLLIDGPYIEEKNDGKNLRGSSNQRPIALTDRYSGFIDYYGSKKAEVEFFVKEDKVVMVGVPDRDIFNRFKNVFKEE